MIKLDFSDLNNNGFKINRLRLFLSTKFMFGRAVKLRNKYEKDNDLTSERNHIVEYLTECNEITYTMFLFFAGLTYLSMILMVLSVFMLDMNPFIKSSFIIFPLGFFMISKKMKENFVMRNVGINMTESIYNGKIRDKYNL